MFGRRVALALALAVVVASSNMVETSTAECSSCRYAAWNCSSMAAVPTISGDGIEQVETIVQQSGGSGKSELRKESAAATEKPVEVCDAQGKIQVDDVFCDTGDCACVDGKQCVSLVLGCQNIFQARSRKRCIGEAAIQQRFQKCATSQQLTTQAKANLNADWVHFKDPKLCKSADCLAVRRFHQCGAVQCGYLVVAWKESASEFRFVVDGSRASDMAAGTFLFSTTTTTATASCHSITSFPIKDCYSLQTRNQQNGTCDGVYFQVDTKLQFSGDDYKLSKLSWPIWITVVGSVAAAVASVASALVVFVRLRRSQRHDELDGLLPESDDQLDCKTPDSAPDSLQEGSTPAVVDMRQRVVSPRSRDST